MDILAIFPELNIEQPTGMDINRILLVEGLAQDNSVDVWIVANGPDEYIEDVSGANIIYSNTSGIPQSRMLLQALRSNFCSASMVQPEHIPDSQTTEGYDIVHVEGVGLGPIVDELNTSTVVWSLVDSPSYRKRRLYRYSPSIPRKIWHYLEWIVANRVESRYGPCADVVHVVSETEAQYLNEHHPGLVAQAIPVALPEAFVNNPRSTVSTNRIAVLGNRNFEDICRGIRRYVYPVLEDLVDSNENIEIVMLGPGSIDVPDNYEDTVKQPGWVEDYVNVLAECTVAVVADPVGSGIKNRTIQSLALGVPVVGTCHAFEGLDVDPTSVGRQISTTSELFGAVQTIMNDDQLRESMSIRGRSWATERYEREEILGHWTSLYESLSSRPSE